MSDREEIWNKYIGKTVSESLCYIGCGSIISQDTFIINDGKPVCKICSNNLQFTNISDFKKHYKLVTPDCYLNVSDEITSENLFNSVLKENGISVFSSKYGYKYALHLLLTLEQREPEIKIQYVGYEGHTRQIAEDSKIWLKHHGRISKTYHGLYIPNAISFLTLNYTLNIMHAAKNQYQCDIIFYVLSNANPESIAGIIKEKCDYEAAIRRKVSLIITYDNDYDSDIKSTFLSSSTNFISVGIQGKTIVAIIDKLGNKPCDKRLEYNYFKLFGGQKLIGSEIN